MPKIASTSSPPRAPSSEVPGQAPEYFTYSCYGALIERLRTKGYCFARFGSEQAHRRVYLRHDIDLSIERAVKMARVEAELGVRSVYFVMLASKLYNVLSPENREEIRHIVAFGHEFGLHLVTESAHDAATISRQCTTEAQLLEGVIGQPIRAFSFHRPPRKQLALKINPPDLINVYAPPYFGPDRYISDSNHHWRCGDPLAFVEEFDGDVLQLLTHPVWWTEAPSDGRTKVERVVAAHDRHIRRYVAENISLARTMFEEAAEADGDEDAIGLADGEANR